MNVQIYKWCPDFRWGFMIRKSFSHREEFLGLEITIFNWEIRIYKSDKE